MLRIDPHAPVAKRWRDRPPSLVATAALMGVAIGIAMTDAGAGGELLQEGTASYYGKGFHGRLTAHPKHERFDKNAMTAAHPTLPFDTCLVVQNLDNGREVQVRVNDRGPFVGKRIIDLSEGVARKLDMIGPGTAPVRLSRC